MKKGIRKIGKQIYLKIYNFIYCPFLMKIWYNTCVKQYPLMELKFKYFTNSAFSHKNEHIRSSNIHAGDFY